MAIFAPDSFSSLMASRPEIAKQGGNFTNAHASGFAAKASLIERLGERRAIEEAANKRLKKDLAYYRERDQLLREPTLAQRAGLLAQAAAAAPRFAGQGFGLSPSQMTTPEGVIGGVQGVLSGMNNFALSMAPWAPSLGEAQRWAFPDSSSPS